MIKVVRVRMNVRSAAIDPIFFKCLSIVYIWYVKNSCASVEEWRKMFVDLKSPDAKE
jgi:hypothetical protein